MKTRYLFLLFIIVALVQIAIPAQMIWQHEAVLDSGNEYKFKVRPIDPTDPFRGKYITLDFEINSAETTDSIWNPNDKVYIYLDKDSLGFATLHRIGKEKVTHSEKDFVVGHVSWYDHTANQLYFNLPFNRFYMDEYKAKDAEDAYRSGLSEEDDARVYARVLLKGEVAVLENVYIDDIPIAEFVEE